MYCHRRLVAFLFAALGVSCNKRQDSLPSNLDANSNSSAIILDFFEPSFVELDQVTLSGIRSPVGIGSERSLNCSLRWSAVNWTWQESSTNSAAETTLNLQLILSSFDGSVEGLQRCKGKVEELVRGRKEVSYRSGTLHSDSRQIMQESVKRRVRLDESLQQERQSMLSSYNQVEHRFNASLLERTYRGPLAYLSSFIPRNQTVGNLANAVKKEKLRSQNESDLISLRHNSINVEKGLRQVAFKNGSSINRPRHEGILNEVHDVQKSYSLSAGASICKTCYSRNDDALVNGHRVERRNQRIWAAAAIFAVAAVAAGFLWISLDIPKYYERIQRRFRVSTSTQRGQISESPNTFSYDVFDGENPKLSLGNLLKGRAGVQQQEYYEATATDDTERKMENLLSIRRRYSRFGHLASAPRRRIQDLFDLESLKSRNKSGMIQRIPVLPRAPNASVRRKFRNLNLEGMRQDVYDEEDSQAPGSQSGTIHTANSCRKCDVPLDCIGLQDV